MSGEHWSLVYLESLKKIALILAKELCSNKTDEISNDGEGKLAKSVFFLLCPLI